MKRKYHTKQWFKNRVGKRIYQIGGYCHCSGCERAKEKGIIVKKGMSLLWQMQYDLGIEFSDKKAVK